MDPVFLGCYPADMLEFFGAKTDLSFIREGDLATIASPLDFFGLNYYTDAVVAADPSSPAQYTTIKPLPRRFGPRQRASIHRPSASRRPAGRSRRRV